MDWEEVLAEHASAPAQSIKSSRPIPPATPNKVNNPTEPVAVKASKPAVGVKQAAPAEVAEEEEEEAPAEISALADDEDRAEQ